AEAILFEPGPICAQEESVSSHPGVSSIPPVESADEHPSRSGGFRSRWTRFDGAQQGIEASRIRSFVPNACKLPVGHARGSFLRLSANRRKPGCLCPCRCVHPAKPLGGMGPCCE